MKLGKVDKIADGVAEIAQGLLLLLAITMFILFIAAIAYGIWEGIAGSVFHVERNTVAIVTAISLCGMQFKGNK